VHVKIYIFCICAQIDYYTTMPTNQSYISQSVIKMSQEKLSFFQMMQSVAASFFGVQSSKNRERDFKNGNYKHFILIGILMTALWYGSIYFVVTLIV